jgi:hypothetical protein
LNHANKLDFALGDHSPKSAIGQQQIGSAGFVSWPSSF